MSGKAAYSYVFFMAMEPVQWIHCLFLWIMPANPADIRRTKKGMKYYD